MFPLYFITLKIWTFTPATIHQQIELRSYNEKEKIPIRQKWVKDHFGMEWNRKGKRNRRKGIINLNVPYHSLSKHLHRFLSKVFWRKITFARPLVRWYMFVSKCLVELLSLVRNKDSPSMINRGKQNI